jgi:hypothetical protein
VFFWFKTLNIVAVSSVRHLPFFIKIPFGNMSSWSFLLFSKSAFNHSLEILFVYTRNFNRRHIIT